MRFCARWKGVREWNIIIWKFSEEFIKMGMKNEEEKKMNFL